MVVEHLPPELKTKIIGFGEIRMGAYKADLILRDGRVVRDVTLAWGDEVVGVGGGTTVDFDPADVIDAVEHAE